MEIAGMNVEEGSVYRYSLMQEECVIINFTTDEAPSVGFGDTIEFGGGNGLPTQAGGTYVCLTSPNISYDNNSGGYKCSVRYDKSYWMMDNYILKYSPVHGKEECSWKLTAQISVFATILARNLSAAGVGVSSVDVSGVASGEAIAMSFDGTSILGAVNAIAQKWNCQWWVSGSTLHFGKFGSTGGQSWTLGKEVESMSPSSSTLLPNKFYVFGGDKNIPHWYGKSWTVPDDLPLSCYHLTDGAAIALGEDPDNEDTASLLYEGEHSAMVWWTFIGDVTKGTTIKLDFGAPSVSVAWTDEAEGPMKVYLQYSDNGKDFNTLDVAILHHGENLLELHKTKTYFTPDGDQVYMRLLVELMTDENCEKGWVNVVPTFSPSACVVEKGDAKLGALPYSCFTSSDASGDVAYGVVTTRLNGGTVGNGGKVTKEAILVFDDIYPKADMTWQGAGEQDNYTETTLDNGEKVKTWFKTYRTKVSEDFSSQDILSGKTLRVHFEDGPLAGMEFDAAYNPDGWSDLDNRSHMIEIVRNEDYGRPLPDGTLKPMEGNTFTLLNFDVSCFSESLVDEAEATLKSKASEYITDLVANSAESIDCTMRCDIDGAYDPGTGVTIGAFNGFVTGCEIPLDIPYDHPRYTIGNSAGYSAGSEMKKSIEGKTYDGSAYAGGGSNIYIITAGDGTMAGDGNVYSAKRCDGNYVSKNANDTVNGIISFAQGLISMGIIKSIGKVVSMKGFESDDYHSNERGFFLGKAGEGLESRTLLEVDELKVRKKMSYDMVNVKRRTYIGGSLAITCGAVEVTSAMTKAEIDARIAEINAICPESPETEYETKLKEELDEELALYEGAADGFSRCFYKAKDENNAIVCDLVADDYVIEETFNMENNSRYWLRVSAVGQNPHAGYNWVDLDLSGNRTGNAMPAGGDVLVQFGHVRDPKRQNAILISADDTGAPLINTYHGIGEEQFEDDNYTGCEAIMQYYDENTGKMAFKVYGDFYAGTHDGTSFAKFDGSRFEVSGVVKASAIYHNMPTEVMDSEHILDPGYDGTTALFMGHGAKLWLPNPAQYVGLQYTLSTDSDFTVYAYANLQNIVYKRGATDKSGVKNFGHSLFVGSGTIVLMSIPVGNGSAQWRLISADGADYIAFSDDWERPSD